MSDVLYHVRTVYETDTKGAVGSMGALGAEAGRLSGVLGTLGGVARAALTAGFVVGGASALAGLAALAHGVNTLNGDVDSLSVGIAGMVAAADVSGTEGPAGWANAMGFAEQTMVQIRRDAAALPGEAEDFIEVFRAGLPGALESGMRAADVAQFTNRFAAVGIAFRVDAPQIGRDLNLMLQGRAGAHVNMWNRLKSVIGKTSEEFNHLSAAERRVTIDSALRRYQPMIDAYANTWEALTSTTISYGKDLLRLATSPFFNVAKKELRSVNDWWARNETRIDEMANGIGHRLVNAYKLASGEAHHLWDVMDRLSASPAVGRLLGFGRGVASGASSLAARALGAMQANPTATAVGAAGAAGMAAGLPGLGLVAGGLIHFAQNTEAVNSVMDSMAGIGGSLLGVLDPLFGLFTSLEQALGVLFVAALPGVFNGLEMMTQGMAEFIAMLAPQIGNLLDALGPVFQFFGGVLGDLAGFIGSTLLDTLRELGHELSGFLSGLAQITRYVVQHMGGEQGFAHNTGQGLRQFDSRLQAFGMTMWDQLSGRMTGLSHEERQARDRQNLYSARLAHGLDTEGNWDPSVSRLTPTTPAGASPPNTPTPLSAAMHGLTTALERLREPLTHAQVGELGAARGLRNRTPAHPGHPVVNVHITQTINQNEDPERVLLLTRRGVMMGIYAPLQTPGMRVTH